MSVNFRLWENAMVVQALAPSGVRLNLPVQPLTEAAHPWVHLRWSSPVALQIIGQRNNPPAMFHPGMQQGPILKPEPRSIHPPRIRPP